MLKYFYGFVLVTAIGIMYEKYRMKYYPDDELNKIGLIKEFLLNDEDLGKPILWIHTTHNVNARNWQSFYSRSTDKLNQPYIISCVETMIKHCGKSFNICLISDDSFKKILPNWKINLDGLADPVKNHVRQLALMKTLHSYGGMLIPNSTIVMKDLKSIYNKGLMDKTCFSVECNNKTSTADFKQLMPTTKIIGCKRLSPCMNELLVFLEQKISSDYTDEWSFLGETSKFIYKLYNENKLELISGKTFGIVDKNCNIVIIDDLMGNKFIDYDSSQLYAIYIPAKEILSRTQYQWFARLSQQQLRNCDNMVAKYLLVAQG